MPVRRLVLWDVDGTLVLTAGAGRDAFADAFAAVFGRPADELVPMAGRTDLDIAHEILARNRIENASDRIPAFTEALAAALSTRADAIRARGRALPGAEAALEALDRRPDVVQSVLTGNLPPNAALKLAAFGLDRYLDLEIGAYGSDHRRRGDLVAVARANARAKHGIDLAPRETVLVGDTPLDVAAGREGGARVVGVASGAHSSAELQDAGADAVLEDLRETSAVLAAVMDER